MRVESIVWLRAPLTSRDLSTAFALGYLAQLAGDAIYGLGSRLEQLQFLLWPVMLVAYPRLYEKYKHMKERYQHPCGGCQACPNPYGWYSVVE